MSRSSILLAFANFSIICAHELQLKIYCSSRKLCNNLQYTCAHELQQCGFLCECQVRACNTSVRMGCNCKLHKCRVYTDLKCVQFIPYRVLYPFKIRIYFSIYGRQAARKMLKMMFTSHSHFLILFVELYFQYPLMQYSDLHCNRHFQ